MGGWGDRGMEGWRDGGMEGWGDGGMGDGGMGLGVGILVSPVRPERLLRGEYPNTPCHKGSRRRSRGCNGVGRRSRWARVWRGRHWRSSSVPAKRMTLGVWVASAMCMVEVLLESINSAWATRATRSGREVLPIRLNGVGTEDIQQGGGILAVFVGAGEDDGVAGLFWRGYGRRSQISPGRTCGRGSWSRG